MSEFNWNELYQKVYLDHKKLEKECNVKRDRLKQLKLEIAELEKDIIALEKILKSSISSNHTILIDWNKFVKYASETINMWTHCTSFKSADYRWWCKAPSCPTGGSGRISDYKITHGYSLKTKSHTWRICDFCREYTYNRESVLTRPKETNSTRPDLGLAVELDPFTYGDPKIAKDLLALAGVIVNEPC